MKYSDDPNSGLDEKVTSWVLKISLARTASETTTHVEAPIRICMRGPYWRARVWKDLGKTEPIKWRWPMMGSAGGLGGVWMAGRGFNHDLMKKCTSKRVMKEMKDR